MLLCNSDSHLHIVLFYVAVQLQYHIWNYLRPSHPERPDRVSNIWDALEKAGCVGRCTRVEVCHLFHDNIGSILSYRVGKQLKKNCCLCISE